MQTLSHISSNKARNLWDRTLEAISKPSIFWIDERKRSCTFSGIAV
jgi:hypothetical protein